jgi:hypothetical protein
MPSLLLPPAQVAIDPGAQTSLRAAHIQIPPGRDLAHTQPADAQSQRGIDVNDQGIHAARRAQVGALVTRLAQAA